MIGGQKTSLFILRVVVGWMFFFSGISKLLNPNWSAESYLTSAKTFHSFYAWLASPGISPFTNLLNEWGLTLIGIAVIFGIFVRPASFLGALMMILYWFPILDFPYPNPNSFIVDQHIIYSAAFLVLATCNAGMAYGFREKYEAVRGPSKYPRLRSWFEHLI